MKGYIGVDSTGSIGATTFTSLTDVPSSYSGGSLKSVRVKSDESGLEFFTPASGGDVSSNTSTSVDGEVVLFNGTSGKSVKRASGTGLAKLTSGILGTATSGTDYLLPSGSGASLTGITATQVGALPSTAFSGFAKITVGTSTPVGPSTGDLWVDTN